MARVLYAADDFSGTAGDTIASRTLNGAGLVPPRGVWTAAGSGGGGGPAGNVVLDGSGRAYESVLGSTTQYWIDGLPGPSFDGVTYDIEVDIERTGAGGGGGATLIQARIADLAKYVTPTDGPPGQTNLGCYYTAYQGGIGSGTFRAYGGGQIGTVARPQWASTANVPFTVRVEVRTGAGILRVYFNGALVTTITDPLFAGDVARNFSSGPPGIRFLSDSLGVAWKVTAYRIYTFGLNPYPPPLPPPPVPPDPPGGDATILWAWSGRPEYNYGGGSQESLTQYRPSQVGNDNGLTVANEHAAGNRLRGSATPPVTAGVGFFVSKLPELAASGTPPIASIANGSFVGNKFWHTGLGKYVRCKRLSIQGKFLFTTPVTHGYELWALHAKESSFPSLVPAGVDPASSGSGAGPAAFDTDVQCWLALRPDGRLELFRNYVTTSYTTPASNSPASPPTGTSLGVSPNPIPDVMAITPAAAADGSGGNDFKALNPAKLRRYLFDIEIDPVNGRLGVWKENDDGSFTLFWCLTGINTQGSATRPDVLLATVGQRGGHAFSTFAGSTTDQGLTGYPFPADSPTVHHRWAYRFQEIVFSTGPLGPCDLVTLFPNADGSIQQFSTVKQPSGAGPYPRWRLQARDPFDLPLFFANPPVSSDSLRPGVVQSPAASPGQVELCQHEALPALAADQRIAGIGVCVEMAGRNNTPSFVPRGRPVYRVGGVTVGGVPRYLFEANGPETGAAGGSPSSSNGPVAPYVEAWEGHNANLYYRDWYTWQQSGAAWTPSAVNAIEIGAIADTAPVYLQRTYLYVVVAGPMPTGSPPPPPPPPPPGGPGLIRVQKNGAFRDVPFPSGVRPFANGAFRTVISGAVMQRGVWRPLSAGDPEVNGDPGDDGPVDVECNVVPGPSVEPAPLTDRALFCYNLAESLINLSPFTASVNPLGSWIPAALATAASRGGAVIGNVGGYEKFRTGGTYDPPKMDAWIASHIPYGGTLQSRALAGTFYGVLILDDFRSPTLWPPSGIDDAEIARICAVWKAQFPWIRVSIRGRPSQLVGGSFPNLDSCLTQFRQGVGTPAAFRTAELAAAASIGISGVLWSLNFLNGGDGSSGFPGTRAGMFEMSPTEVTDVGLAFAAAATEATGIANHGVGGWKYSASFLTRPGMMGALTTVRNALAAL